MTNKEFAFNCAGKGYMYYGHKVVLVGYDAECLNTVIVSPVESRTDGCFWEGHDSGDRITYRANRTLYQYAQIDELKPVPEVKPKTPGECIAYCEGQQGMNYSVVNGCVSAVYKRQGSALKLVSRGDSINNVTEKI